MAVIEVHMAAEMISVINTKTKPQSMGAKLVEKNGVLSSMLPLVFRILSAGSNFIPGGEATIEKLKEKTKLVGFITYFQSIYSLSSGESQPGLKKWSVVLKVVSRTAGYLLLVPPLLTTSPWVLTTVVVAKVATELLSGGSLVLSIGNLYLNTNENTSPNYLMISALSAYTYVRLVPIFFIAPMLIEKATFVGDVIIGSFAMDSVIKDVVGYVFPKQKYSVGINNTLDEDSALIDVFNEIENRKITSLMEDLKSNNFFNSLDLSNAS